MLTVAVDLLKRENGNISRQPVETACRQTGDDVYGAASVVIIFFAIDLCWRISAQLQKCGT
jgi:hypothetical protein